MAELSEKPWLQPMHSLEEIKAALIARRQELGLSERALGKMVHREQSWVAALLRGKYNSQFSTIDLLAYGLDLQIVVTFKEVDAK